jgi:hypothetical protein
VGDPPSNNWHFTYRSPDGADLHQGDLLSKTDRVSALLREIHPHYHSKEDYTHFAVLTQTCDLVRRDDKPCKARYISLAAVRPLSLVIEREIANFQDDFDRRAGVCSRAKRDLLEQFIERVLNNNNPEYFYFEPEPAFGLHQPSCAFLRLSVAVRAHDHYEELLEARQLCLEEIFQAKLGWLVGNMYSRVGTEDWVPDNLPRHEFKEKVHDLLDNFVRWFDAEHLKAAKKIDNRNLSSQEELRLHIEETKPAKKKDRVLDTVLKIAREQKLLSDEEAASRLRTRLENDPDFSGLVK